MHPLFDSGDTENLVSLATFPSFMATNPFTNKLSLVWPDPRLDCVQACANQGSGDPSLH